MQSILRIFFLIFLLLFSAAFWQVYGRLLIDDAVAKFSSALGSSTFAKGPPGATGISADRGLGSGPSHWSTYYSHFPTAGFDSGGQQHYGRNFISY